MASKMPNDRWEQFGSVIEDRPIACGGANMSFDTKECYKYYIETNEWKTVIFRKKCLSQKV